jgi:enoyl-CoA hydratase
VTLERDVAGYSDLTYLDVELRDGIAVVRLSNPGRGNAYTIAGHREMSEIIDRLAADDDVRTAVFTGAGDVFSIGPDREFAAALADPESEAARRAVEEAQYVVTAALACDKPLVAAVNGRIVGGAVAFALVADIVIIERGIELRDVHVSAAMAAGDGGVFLWPLAMGLLRSRRYLLTGDAVSADEAARLGLVTEAVDPGEAFTRAMEFARRFAAGPQAALRATKRALNEVARAGPLAALALSARLEGETMRTPEAAAALDDLVRGGIGAMPPDPRPRRVEP